MTQSEREELMADDRLAQIEQLIESGKDDCLTSEDILGNVLVALEVPRLASSTPAVEREQKRLHSQCDHRDRTSETRTETTHEEAEQ